MRLQRFHIVFWGIFTRVLLLSFCMLTIHSVAARKSSILLATDPWPPYYGPSLENGGFITAATKEAFSRMGYHCDVVYVPWKRALEMAKKGRYDGLLGAYKTEERTKFFAYSLPVAETHIVLITLKGKTLHFKSLKDLIPYRIGVLRGYHYSKEFDKATYLKKFETTRIEQNIQKLTKGRVDIVIASKEVLLQVMRVKFPSLLDVIKIHQPAFNVKKLYIPISKKAKNYQQIVDDLNNGIKKIKKDGTIKKLKQYYFRAPQNDNKNKTPKS